MEAFRKSLTPFEEKDLTWWVDRIMAEFERYQELVRHTMEQAKQQGMEPGSSDGTQEGIAPAYILRAAAPRLKALWQAVASDLEIAYAFHGRPNGPEKEQMKAWASNLAQVHRVKRAHDWQTFLDSLGFYGPSTEMKMGQNDEAPDALIEKVEQDDAASEDLIGKVEQDDVALDDLIAPDCDPSL